MKLSILIVNWNTKEELRQCLRSLHENPPAITHEIIVVDNASSDGSAAMVVEEFPEVTLRAENHNHGYAKGNNLAFEVAQGEFCLTLNPDTEVPSGTIETTLRPFDADPAVGVVSCQFIGLDGETQQSIRAFPSLRNLWADLFGRGPYRQPDFDYSQSQKCEQPMGTYLLFRRAALPDPQHPFDEGFPIFFNEVDLLYRMRVAGWTAYYCAEARILHHGGMSTRQVRRNMIWESHLSLIRYLKKHAAPRERLLLPVAAAAIWLGAFVRARGVYARFRP